MKVKKATLYIYQKTEKGWRYVKPPRAANGKVIPQTGKYYLNFGGKWIPLGECSATHAVERLNLFNAQKEYEARGGKVAAPTVANPLEVEGAQAKPVAAPKANMTLEEAKKSYLAKIDLDVRAGQKKPRTLASCKSITDEFVTWMLKNTKHSKLQQVTSDDVSRYMAWAIEQSRTKSNRTAANKYARIGNMFKYLGHPICNHRESPKYDKNKRVRVYIPTELRVFFAACTDVEHIIFTTFLKTGLREQELMYLERMDIDPVRGSITIKSKREYGFSPKTWGSREVFLDDDLLGRLQEHLKTHNYKLVFPTEDGKPNGHLLRLLKRICKRAGLDSSTWKLHAFRSSCATNWLRAGLDIPTVQKLLGHAHGSQSIWRYLAEIQGDALRDKLNNINARQSAAA